VAADPVRDAGVGVLLRVFEHGAFLERALDRTLGRRQLSDRGRRFLTQLVYGTVRHRLLCDYVLEGRLHQPLDELPGPIRAILRMGVFQSLFCRQVTFPSMVHTSVELAKRRGHAGTARLVNAVLRRVPQGMEDVALPPLEDRARYLSVRYSVPQWLVAEWLSEHGDAGAEKLCDAAASEAPVTLRTNTLKTTPEQLLGALGKAGCVAEKRTAIPEEVTVVTGPPPARSKQFDQGHFLVQDGASMLPPHLLEPQPGERVLDLCAAPGGKATHVAQLTQGHATVVAMDVQPGRLHRVSENAERLATTRVALLAGDGANAPLRPDFDRVLVDAPCSGLGTLRRHPDLKWRAAREDRERLTRCQSALLRSGVGVCKNGGVVVYSVCTFTRAETTNVVATVLNAGGVELEDGPEWLSLWKIETGQYRILPENGGLDGYFLTRLRKVS